ncbi:4-hydroxyphenylacetate permease [Serratia sp. DD3]|nr:4-hydroxyphenylacetate permease [Serratia sp. DD3]
MEFNILGLHHTYHRGNEGVRHSQQHHAGDRRCTALDCDYHGDLWRGIYRHDIRYWPNSLYVLRMLVGIAEAGFLPGLRLSVQY